MNARGIGVLLVAAGVLLVVIGLVAMGGWLSWFGRLPGDVRIERENVRVYVPIVSMLLISVVLSLLMWVARRSF
ncbi:MAG TPA: DUF2905 domain-containing protein [Gemmatimonadaceae bacterium]|nr:DUF2905 domain-containing protein [Gemmatimonadaceae bacterium]